MIRSILRGLVVAAFVLTLSGCGALALNAPIAAVNGSKDALTDVNTTLAQIESRQLTDAINAAADKPTAEAAKATIGARYHAAWEAYDAAKAAWALARVAVAEYEAIEASGGVPDLPGVLKAAADLAAKFNTLKAVVKEIAK